MTQMQAQRLQPANKSQGSSAGAPPPDTRRLRAEVQTLKEANADLKEALHETRQSYLVVKEERDALKQKLSQYKSDIDNLDRIVRDRVNKALKTN